MAAVAEIVLFVSGQWLTSMYNCITWAADNAYRVADRCLGQQNIGGCKVLQVLLLVGSLLQSTICLSDKGCQHMQ